MLGMSVGKFLVLALVIAIVWYGFKWLGSRGQGNARRGGGRASARPDTGTDLVPCSACGTYVPRGSVHCGSRQDGDG